MSAKLQNMAFFSLNRDVCDHGYYYTLVSSPPPSIIFQNVPKNVPKLFTNFSVRYQNNTLAVYFKEPLLHGKYALCSQLQWVRAVERPGMTFSEGLRGVQGLQNEA